MIADGVRIALPRAVDPVALRRCDPRRPVQTLSGAALGTSWQVRYGALRPIDGEALQAAIQTRLAAIVAQMSQWEPTSLLSRFNAAPAGTWIDLPADFAAVVDCAQDVVEASGGAFDPTHGKAAALLGFGAVPVTRPPTSAEMDDAMASAGWRRLVYDASARRLRQPGGLWLDFSGIAKGYTADAISVLLADRGIEDMLVEIGGELVGRGLRPDGQPWWVDLEMPPGVSLQPMRIGLHDSSVATSGNYVRGAHTLDPRAGRPVERGIVSLSVVHRSAMLADAWATALTVAGAAALPDLAARESLAVRCIERRGDDVTEWLSPQFSEMLAD